MRTVNDIASFLEATGTKLKVWGSGDEWYAELSVPSVIVVRGEVSDSFVESDRDLSHAITKVITRYRLS